MHMNLSLTHSFSLDLKLKQSWEWAGGLTKTIFPITKDKMNTTENLNAILYIGKRKQIGRYRSIMDFLFCEINPQYKKHCFKYYEDGEERLKDILEDYEIVYHDAKLICAIKVAFNLYNSEKNIKWDAYRNLVENIFNKKAKKYLDIGGKKCKNVQN